MATKEAKNAIRNFFIVVAIILIVLTFLYTKNTPAPVQNSTQILYFYGNTCPNCKVVEKYIEERNMLEVLGIVKKEVYNNQDNQKELISYAEKCGINLDSLGVPFIYHNGKCYMGRDEAINFLNSQMPQ